MQGRLSLGVSRGAPKEEVIGGSGRAGGRGGGGANPGAMGGKKKKPAGGGLRTGEVARGRMAAGQRPIAESTRLDVVAALLRFREAGGEQELAFPPGLSNDDRALVHQECRKYGFTSKSYGKGEARFVRVSKPRAPGGPGGGGSAPPASWLPLPPPACRALADLFARDPLSAAEAEALAAEARAGAGGAGGGGGGRGAPSPHPAAAAAPGEGAAAAGRRGKRKGKGGGAGAAPDPARAENFPPERVARELAALRARRRPDVEGPRARLPIAEHRARIVEAVGRHRVVLVAGATGCGKTTQVPQYLLEAEWEAGRACRVVCTQPRRLSAVSVADRIATEMGEPVGRSVGYSIRLEGRGGPESSVVFCTNGVLLRQLTQTGGLAASGGRGGAVAGATHLIVDEIHERDKFADFLLVILRDLLAADPGLRVVLMSATMQMGLFSQYFGGCPVVEVPGFVYPVEQLYLDDIVPEVYAASPAAAASARGAVEAPAEMQEAIMQAFLQGSDAAFARLLELAGAAAAGAPPSASPGGAAAPLVNARHRETGATALMVAAGKGRAAEVSVLMANGADPELRSRDGGRAVDWATRFGHFAVAEALLQCAEALAHVQRTAGAAQELSRYQMAANPEEVDLDLVARILRHVALQSADAAATQRRKGQIGPGAALVFLPGWDEISRLKDLLEASPPFSDAARFRVLPLHSMVPSAEQRKVFQSPGPGVMKIVLATNIAETAVTIDDIVYVINSGRHKEKSYDAYTAVSTLQTAWISQASAQQRKGRAGRCRPGVCFHLYSRARSEGLDEFQLPELKRTPLEEIGLQIKVMQEKSGGADSIAAFLAKAVEPPAAKAVENAVDLLRAIGALAPEGEALTELGRHLAAFPLPPQVGKMLLFGSLFGCLDPVLTAACAAAYRDPWVIPVDTRARRAADAARSGAAQRGGGGAGRGRGERPPRHGAGLRGVAAGQGAGLGVEVLPAGLPQQRDPVDARPYARPAARGAQGAGRRAGGARARERARGPEPGPGARRAGLRAVPHGGRGAHGGRRLSGVGPGRRQGQHDGAQRREGPRAPPVRGVQDERGGCKRVGGLSAPPVLPGADTGRGAATRQGVHPGAGPRSGARGGEPPGGGGRGFRGFGGKRRAAKFSALVDRRRRRVAPLPRAGRAAALAPLPAPEVERGLRPARGRHAPVRNRGGGRARCGCRRGHARSNKQLIMISKFHKPSFFIRYRWRPASRPPQKSRRHRRHRRHRRRHCHFPPEHCRSSMLWRNSCRRSSGSSRSTRCQGRPSRSSCWGCWTRRRSPGSRACCCTGRPGAA